MKRSFMAVLWFVCALTLTAAAQRPTNSATNADGLYSTAPYRVGEKLTYNVSFSNFANAAHVELFVAGQGKYFGQDAVVLQAHVETNEVVSAALLSLNHDYITYIAPENGQPFRTQMVVREGEYTTQDVSDDYHKAHSTTALPLTRSGVLAGEFDFLSALYRFRAMQLAEKGVYSLTVRQGSKPYSAQLRVLGRATVKTNVGSFRTLETEITTNDANANSYRPRVYFSDDDRHVPILIKLRHHAGEIIVQLAGSEFIRPATNAPAGSLPPVTGDDSEDQQPPQPKPVRTPQPVNTSLRNVAVTNTLGTLPFLLGEQLNYNLYLTRFKEPVGTASYEVQRRENFLGRDALFFSVQAATNASLQRLFTAKEQITSIVDFKTLLPLRSDLNMQEGKRNNVQQLNWDQDRGVVVAGNGPRIEIPVGTHDYLSLFYALRSFNITPKKRTAVVLLINNRPRTLYIESLKRDTIELGEQRVPAILLALTIDDAAPDRYVMRLWISDDSRRLPLRLTATLNQGVVRADLIIAPTR